MDFLTLKMQFLRISKGFLDFRMCSIDFSDNFMPGNDFLNTFRKKFMGPWICAPLNLKKNYCNFFESFLEFFILFLKNF